MKNLLFLIGISMIFLISCAKEEISVNDLDGVKIENRAPLPKMDVCHYDAEFDTWHVININMNAWPAHEAHGDVRLDDPDGDGFFPFNECGYEPMGDCNDFDATIYPGAEEICGDEIDQDCDGQDASCCPYFTVELIASRGAYSFYDSENRTLDCFCDDNNSVTIYGGGVINANLGDDCLQDGILTYDLGWVYDVDAATISACQVVMRQAILDLGLYNECDGDGIMSNTDGVLPASTDAGVDK